MKASLKEPSRDVEASREQKGWKQLSSRELKRTGNKLCDCLPERAGAKEAGLPGKGQLQKDVLLAGSSLCPQSVAGRGGLFAMS